jgi:ribosome-associated protein
MATRKPATTSTGSRATSRAKKKPAAPVDPEETLARLCADAALDKKAEDVVILDMRGISSFTDFFVIVSGTSEPQLKAIAGSIRERVREATGQRPTAEDGFPVSQWVIVDYGSVIVHIFHTEKRHVYGLEDLWNDAKRIEITH